MCLVNTGEVKDYQRGASTLLVVAKVATRRSKNKPPIPARCGEMYAQSKQDGSSQLVSRESSKTLDLDLAFIKKRETFNS